MSAALAPDPTPEEDPTVLTAVPSPADVGERAKAPMCAPVPAPGEPRARIQHNAAIMQIRVGKDLQLVVRHFHGGAGQRDQVHYQAHGNDGRFLATIAMVARGSDYTGLLQEACEAARMVYGDRL